MGNTSHKLRTRMKEKDLQSRDVIKLLGHGSKYVSDRMLQRLPWSLCDVYQLCEALDIPWEEIPLYFPRLHSAEQPQVSPAGGPPEPFPQVEAALRQQLGALAAQVGACQAVVSFTFPAEGGGAAHGR